MSGWDREMQEALEADGEKLAALTGEDHGPSFMAAILVDAGPSRPTLVEAGSWLVFNLKAAVGIPAHKVLARIDPFGLTALGDDEIVVVEDEMRFVSHVRPGVNS